MAVHFTQYRLEFGDGFDKRLLGQGTEARDIGDSLDLGWELLRLIPPAELTRLSKNTIAEFLNPLAADGSPSPYLQKSKAQ